MNERGCACRPELQTTRDYRVVVAPSCGRCQWCGAAGHVRKPPAPFASRGVWCDRCYVLVRVSLIPRTAARVVLIGAVLFLGALALGPILGVVGDVAINVFICRGRVSHCSPR